MVVFVVLAVLSVAIRKTVEVEVVIVQVVVVIEMLTPACVEVVIREWKNE